MSLECTGGEIVIVAEVVASAARDSAFFFSIALIYAASFINAYEWLVASKCA
jgi:hypothetical protein